MGRKNYLGTWPQKFCFASDELLSIVCSIADGSNVTGVGIFNASIEEVERAHFLLRISVSPIFYPIMSENFCFSAFYAFNNLLRCIFRCVWRKGTTRF